MAAKKQTGGRKSSAPKKKAPPRKKAAPRKSLKKKSPKKGVVQELTRQGLAIAILLAICLTGAMVADIFINPDVPVAKRQGSETRAAQKEAKVKEKTSQPTKTVAAPKSGTGISKPKTPAPEKQTDLVPVMDDALPQTKKKSLGLKKKTIPPAIVYEVFEDVDHGRTKKPARQQSKPHSPQIAIIIDDIGYDKKLAMALYSVHPDITFSVLPFSPHGRSIATKLSAKGAELMLHLPMEPVQYPRVNPGPGALLSSMAPDVLLGQLRKNLDAVPGVTGVNNHMGSKLTADEDKMHQIFTVLKQKNLYFVDSRTSPQSKGETAARMFLLKFSHRDVFLDNFQNVEYISGQLKKLVKEARKHGTAIGIGHPYQATLDTLRLELPKLNGKVELVPASRLVAIPG
ncbi:MAG: divergent polysaccharide deacetylase family protein [Desulfobacterales bacterium]|nr:divergent polysaccharide deacetylase family protein [Desulfobacterales bacterium]